MHHFSLSAQTVLGRRQWRSMSPQLALPYRLMIIMIQILLLPYR